MIDFEMERRLRKDAEKNGQKKYQEKCQQREAHYVCTTS